MTVISSKWVNIPGEIYNLWTDGTLKYWLERITVTDPATSVYGSTLVQVKHLKASGTRGTMTVARQALTAGVSSADYAIRVETSGADSSLDANSYYLIRHYIYHGTRNHSNGGKITVSFEVENSVADQKVGVVLRQNYGTTGSPTAEEIITGEIFTLASGVNNISKTFTTNTLAGKTFGTDNNDCLIVDIVVQCGSTVATSLFGGSAFGFTEATTLDFYEFGTYEGEVAYPFVATDDYLDVLFFYEKGYEDNVLPGTATSGEGATGRQVSYTTGYHHILVKYLVRKRIIVTAPIIYDRAGNSGKMHKIGTGGFNGLISSYFEPSTDGFAAIADNVSQIAGALLECHWVADARY